MARFPRCIGTSSTSGAHTMVTITSISTSMATPWSMVSTQIKTATDYRTGGIKTRATMAFSMLTTSRWVEPSMMEPADRVWFGRLSNRLLPSMHAAWHMPGCMVIPCKERLRPNRPSTLRLTVLGPTISSTRAHTMVVTRRASGPASRIASGSTSSEIRM